MAEIKDTKPSEPIPQEPKYNIPAEIKRIQSSKNADKWGCLSPTDNMMSPCSQKLMSRRKVAMPLSKRAAFLSSALKYEQRKKELQPTNETGKENNNQ
ncbi:hypothetical protein TrispH2_011148 [Trichoplax sp. H2]|nr:hypothetical protein TrispH2_011148 [Trichoplax sp. H2]|eukprot:RDD37064.1 hypothetical protein TrispH2_011148 [Trichoplax sp. H2]